MFLVYNPDGSLDSTFSSDGIFSIHPSKYDFFYSITSDANDNILAAGIILGNAQWNLLLCRVLPNGNLDSTFHLNGVLVDSIRGESEAYRVALQPDGKILVIGYTRFPYEGVVLRYLTNGERDPAFGVNGVSYVPEILEIADCSIDANGDILLYGWTDAQTSLATSAIVKLTSEGLKDSDFADNGIYFNTTNELIGPFSIVGRNDGKIIVCGKNFETYYIEIHRFTSGQKLGVSPMVSPFSHPVKVFPNPVLDYVTFQFELKTPQEIKVDLYTVTGQYLETLVNPMAFTPGEHQIPIYFNGDYPEGIYQLQIFASGQMAESKQIWKE